MKSKLRFLLKGESAYLPCQAEFRNGIRELAVYPRSSQAYPTLFSEVSFLMLSKKASTVSL